ncbi:MAG: universal stress protein [Chitinophagales bacterium]
MYALENIIVALDLSEMDKFILNYTEGLCKLIQPKKVYFLNIQKNFDLDEDDKDLLGLPEDKPFDEHCKAEVKKSVSKHFASFSEFNTEINIIDGNPSEEILKWTKVKNADLLIMGRKKELQGGGMAPQQIASKVNCSILLVPEGITEFKFNNIFVPVNFNEATKLALEEALVIKEKTKEKVDINCHYVFDLPLGYEKSGKSDEEFAERLNINAAKKFKKLKHNLGNEAAIFDYTTELLNGKNIAKVLNAKAKSLKTDLIIMGAKSKTLAAQLFLGNTTKKMIIHDSTTPLLVVKNKKEAFDFWDFFSKH